jgi:hypothetical protein
MGYIWNIYGIYIYINIYGIGWVLWTNSRIRVVVVVAHFSGTWPDWPISKNHVQFSACWNVAPLTMRNVHGHPWKDFIRWVSIMFPYFFPWKWQKK